MKFKIHIFCDTEYELWIFQMFRHKFDNSSFLLPPLHNIALSFSGKRDQESENMH